MVSRSFHLENSFAFASAKRFSVLTTALIAILLTSLFWAFLLWFVLPGDRLVHADGLPNAQLQAVNQSGNQSGFIDPRSALKAGVQAFQQGDYAAAAAAFSSAIDHDPTLTAAHINRCLANLQLEQYAAAVADCTEAIDRSPKLVEAYLNRGLAYHRQGEFAAAIADYSQLLKLQPFDFRAYYNRGLSQMASKAYRAAIVDFGAAARQVSPFDRGTLAEILTDRGLAQLLQANSRQAISDFTAAIQLDRSAVRAFYNRGCAHHQQGNSIAAVADFTQVLELAPNHAQALLSRGVIHRELGETIAAIHDLQQAADCFCHQGMMLAYEKTLELLDQIRFVGVAFG